MRETSDIFKGKALLYLDNLIKAAERPGLWANIRAKRARGEKPAKPGDEDFPDKKQWQKLTAKKAAAPAWQRSEGKNPEGGLNAKGRASYARETGGTLKAPVTESNPKGDRAKRQNSFCSRMCGMKRVNTGGEAKRDPDSRINKALRKWNCKCGAADVSEPPKKEKEHPILRALLASVVGNYAASPTANSVLSAGMKMPGTGGEKLTKQHLSNFFRNSKIPKNLQPTVVFNYRPEAGNWAGYLSKSNMIVGKGKDPLKPGVLAHELGHAQIQHGNNGLLRGLQKYRTLTLRKNLAVERLVSPLASLTATQQIIKDDDSTLEGAGKGAITGLVGHAPALINEADASRRGIEILLRSKMSAKHKLINSLMLLPAFASYVAAATTPSSIFGALTARAKRRVKEKNQKNEEAAKPKTAAQDMEWSRQVGGLPEMAGVFDALKAQVPKVQNAAYNFGGKAYDFLTNLNKNKTGGPQIKHLVAGGQIR